MRTRVKSALMCAVAAGAMLAPQMARETDAFFVIIFPFPPIAECGRVGTVGSWIDIDGDPNTEDTCKVWFAESGGAYLVAGIEDFEVGDEVFVEGQICTTCLTTCFAGAILNAQLSPCP